MSSIRIVSLSSSVAMKAAYNNFSVAILSNLSAVTFVSPLALRMLSSFSCCLSSGLSNANSNALPSKVSLSKSSRRAVAFTCLSISSWKSLSDRSKQRMIASSHILLNSWIRVSSSAFSSNLKASLLKEITACTF